MFWKVNVVGRIHGSSACEIIVKTVASGEGGGGSHNNPPNCDKQMCLIQRREKNVSPLNMTLTTQYFPNSEFIWFYFNTNLYKICNSTQL